MKNTYFSLGFTLDGKVKLIDFGLAKIVESASVDSNETYAMSGETGSLRYMAPEVSARKMWQYHIIVPCYSFGPLTRCDDLFSPI